MSKKLFFIDADNSTSASVIMATQFAGGYTYC